MMIAARSRTDVVTPPACLTFASRLSAPAFDSASGWKTGVVHHFDVVPRLSDGVVILDAHGPDDIELQVAGEDEETARRFGWWPEQSDARTVERAFQDWANDWVLGRGRRTFAVRTDGGRLVGGCELRVQPDGATGRVSYWTNANDRGRGYGSRALALLVDYAASAGLARLESHVAADNVASCRVSERAGFVREESFTAEGGD